MTKLGYWASQEQYSMNDLFEFVKEAEKAGSLLFLNVSATN